MGCAESVEVQQAAAQTPQQQQQRESRKAAPARRQSLKEHGATRAWDSPGARRPAPRRHSSGAPALTPPPVPLAAVDFARMGDAVAITVAHLTGRRDTVRVPAAATVTEVKQAVELVAGVPASQQRLVFAGRQLDDVRSIQHYGIVGGCTLHLAVRQPKGCAKPGLQELLDTYEITLAQSDDLRVLVNYDIVFLVDDSGSMNRVEVTAGVRQSRWQELRDTVAALIEFATYFDDDGTDIYFLNRDGIEGVTDSSDPRLERCFASRPRGGTPLTGRLQEVVQQHPGEKPLLVVLATDGEPDTGAQDFIRIARRLLSGRSGRDVRLAVMACTQDERAVRWLNDLDDDPLVGHKVDVCDDYESEKAEVLASGRVRRFLISDYYVKALLGPILAKYDNLDGGPRAP
eukprot:TRINITY_DN38463_c0_g4_i1.p1 TRINITY_DN38463_c0_g4~~TRINITY_DN38463_c0_g4_i1.p1  ORF type:complete len:432 (+),score=156.64 TRINITY_DN38463_c0_g4_i1:91-1296(+)